MKTRRIWLATIVLAIVVIAGGFLMTLGGQPGFGPVIRAARAAMGEPVKIGALLPMTGSLQAYGETSLNAVKLAIDDVNSQGGILKGRKLEVAVGDTQTKPQAAVQAADQLVTVDGVAGIVGAMSSGDTIPVGKSVAAERGVPMISNASTSPAITNLDDKDFVFRTTPSDSLQGQVLGRLVKQQGLDRVAIIYVNNDYGDGLQRAFSKVYESDGGKVVNSLPYEEKKQSFRGELQRLAKGKPQALLLIGYPGEGIPILKQAVEEGYFNKFIFTDGMKAPEIIKAIGAKVLNGSFGTAPEAPASEGSKIFNDEYQKKFGKMPPKPFMGEAYDAAFILALAIEKAGSTDGKAVRDALRPVAGPPGEKILPGEWSKAKKLIDEGKDIDYAGAAGPQDFDEHGDVPGSIGHWVIKDGEIKTVEILSK